MISRFSPPFLILICFGQHCAHRKRICVCRLHRKPKRNQLKTRESVWVKLLVVVISRFFLMWLMNAHTHRKRKCSLHRIIKTPDVSIIKNFCKVSSVQEAYAKCFAVHLLKFEVLQTTWKNKVRNIKMLNLLVKNWKLRVWCYLFHYFHVICKISNFNMWTAKHLAQASCIESKFIYSEKATKFCKIFT